MRSHIIALLLSLGASHAAFAAPSSTFDSGNDGWTVSDTNPPFDSFGGSFTPDYDEEGQFIRYTDPSAMSFFFEAPESFLGDLSGYYGGTLRYSQTLSVQTPQWRDDPDVVLVNGAGLVLVFQHDYQPGVDWTDFTVSLAEGGWRVGGLAGSFATAAQMQSVLGDLQRLRIRGEYISGVVETTALDNVSITAVPEPASWALMLSGVVLVAGAARRRFG
ncbi:laminin B domain-containing protein [Methyloversatilis discipulorum]|uniref:laminin B domain-containing protein n=1 Tax=Methyloversatilis discipulorum TaxID=1119528 RepID=UPI001A3E5A88|nr:laminin B domain-containing protein [Methyloversatilis discipulorum]MBL8466205.1 PEPxxWA-CTERM sorting domain-containing protein [Methyloversatilis discipulorum]